MKRASVGDVVRTNVWRHVWDHVDHVARNPVGNHGGTAFSIRHDLYAVDDALYSNVWRTVRDAIDRGMKQ